jgi:sugar (pentulose or hexulose) kinase
MPPTITVDVGTTSVKLCSFDADGSLLASSRVDTPTVKDGPGEVYDSETLRAAIVSFIRARPASERGAMERIALTGVGESGGLVREDGSLASPVILWHDHRGAPILEELDAITRERISSITGLPVNPNYGLSKIAWAVAAAGADARDAQWLNVAEYLAATMTSIRWSEYSLASRTMALDLRTREWSAEVCGFVGLDVSVLPTLRPAGYSEPVTATFAALTGLPAHVRVHVAGHDHMVGAAGAGLLPGELLNSTGTTEGLLLLDQFPIAEALVAATKLAGGIACSGEAYTVFASIPTGGSAFATLQDLLALSEADLLTRLANLHTRYCQGKIDLDRMPLVVPRFRGSPPPTKNARARAAFARVSADTTADDLIFATFVGMALQFRDVLDLFPARPTAIRVIGPASRNPLWLQLKADLLGVPLLVSAFPEVVSRGAQALASGETPASAASEWTVVEAGSPRGAQLQAWANEARALWECLKDSPK